MLPKIRSLDAHWDEDEGAFPEMSPHGRRYRIHVFTDLHLMIEFADGEKFDLDKNTFMELIVSAINAIAKEKENG